ncbi:hypothetical protein GLOIN_2v1875701 [Rhizophagus irregularis DAOM 181602=DAOM 197198]|uniref:Uncharacterized protein n=1 Tax=Rhizophagus irregularis (strain DAOM 181602 / DAOM 197198 / MUCL 43194) TaxID=747089 RepID=U9TNV5_RHIID|nr:hypothetical protein GLOIN_2v1875701 [Rhizophagus irregularis DAOM 181602=DAOM 197198]POG71740.1 hypothetical protein GLOIN_2v1875701 [Rhizophagus irregularis DAOM 181602=DAOM 197198]GBC14627.1 hypothetical protein GLOIN_2v1875701 [Rhizophagus irregularis DAOM 181602=DAOM 197198]CAG8630160.1 8177_t:CDS:2 [Rhizophagus irregularis]|eukprot:XP_025178606.1 hypothetical protein GLOIN_2v1875701 [Rhizophagus irregularis DAOM 181602=DAOM 197198]
MDVSRWVVGLESEVCRLLETNMHLERDKNHKDKYSQNPKVTSEFISNLIQLLQEILKDLKTWTKTKRLWYQESAMHVILKASQKSKIVHLKGGYYIQD